VNVSLKARVKGSKGMARLARGIGVTREGLYKSLSPWRASVIWNGD